MGAFEDEKLVIGIITEYTRRIHEALRIAKVHGQTDGGHHKMWVIDQMVRVLAGPKDYEKFVAEYSNGDNGPETYSWDEGREP